MVTDQWVINSDYSKQVFLDHMSKMYDEHKYLRVSIKTGKQRSGQQNKALHVYLKLLADALNDAGLDMKKTLKPEIDIPWDADRTKEFLWKPIQFAMTKKKSTTKPNRNEYTEIYEVLNRHTADKFGISIPFPCKKDK